jgi:hypothetical protein
MADGALYGTEIRITTHIRGEEMVYRSTDSVESLSASFDEVVDEMSDAEWYGFTTILGAEIRINRHFLVDAQFHRALLVDVEGRTAPAERQKWLKRTSRWSKRPIQRLRSSIRR